MSATPPTSGSQLLRTLGPVMAIAVIVGTVIGSGIFKKPQSLAHNVPYSGLVLLVWVAAGLLVLLGALAYAEVSVLLPKAGGNYVFLRESYGRLAGFLWGWVDFLIIRAASLAALATIFAESCNDLIRNAHLRQSLGLAAEGGLLFWEERILTVAVILGLAWVNARGTRWGGGLQVFITSIKVGSLLFILILPFLALAFASSFGAVPSTENLKPFWPEDWGAEVARTKGSLITGLGTAFLGVLWAYHGWMNLTPVAAEVTRPQRNLPLALLGGVLIVIFLYVGANIAYYSILNGEQLAEMSATPVVTGFCMKLLGPVGAAVASGAVMCSVFGALNGNLLIAPRLLYAMGEDGLAPAALREVHPRYHTPARAIWVMAAWAALLVLAVGALKYWGALDKIKSPFDVLTDFAMFGAVIFETMAVLSIFVLRRKMADAERPYRCPGYPVVPALYVILPGFVLGNMFVAQRFEAMAGIGFITAGVFCYYLLGLNRTGPAPMSPYQPVSPQLPMSPHREMGETDNKTVDARVQG